MPEHTATVEVLTAKVRVLMVGSRQVTLSVARQLDNEGPTVIKPFGRARILAKPHRYDLEVIGQHTIDGSLCRSQILVRPRSCNRGMQGAICGWDHGEEVIVRECAHAREYGHTDHRWTQYLHDPVLDSAGDSSDWEGIYREWQTLPLIVLAGLR